MAVQVGAVRAYFRVTSELKAEGAALIVVILKINYKLRFGRVFKSKLSVKQSFLTNQFKFNQI